jgi:hypothetical protein
MNDTHGCGVARVSLDDLPTGLARAADGPRRRVVVAPVHGRWDLVTLLRLRAARPDLRVELTSVRTDADGVAAAFRGGADAYVAGCGDPDTDRRFVQGHCGEPLFAPLA